MGICAPGTAGRGVAAGTKTIAVLMWHCGKGGVAAAHAEPIPQPRASGATFVPEAQSSALQPRSPGPVSPLSVLPTAGAGFSSGDQKGRNSAGDEKKQTESSIKGELPLASVHCNWIRSLSDLPICGGVSSPGAAQSQSVRPGGAVCSSAGVPADRGDLAFID